MATQDDQPRPDLDAAIDVVLPSLTAVSDDAAAQSLRRTRAALADGRGRLRSGWTASPRRWALPVAVALTVALIAVSAWWPKTPAGPVPRVVVSAPAPMSAPLSPAPSTVAPKHVARAEPGAPRPDRRRSVLVEATSAVPTTPESSRPDPLIALVRALQQIPEDAWQASVARSDAPLPMPDVPVDPIVIVPLDTPSLGDQTAEPLAPGEP